MLRQVQASKAPHQGSTSDLAALRTRVRAAAYVGEESSVGELLVQMADLDTGRRAAILDAARSLVHAARRRRGERGSLDAFLEEFGLSNREGVALMCLAEALLRVPDVDTIDALIADKVRLGDWLQHHGRSDSVFVNASALGLALTGRILEVPQQPSSWFRDLLTRVGEPVVRAAMQEAMRIMGGQYVLGRTIEEAIVRARGDKGRGMRFSFDMLGEAARTDSDAQRYFESYRRAIARVADGGPWASPVEADGVSVKLSALNPRYQHRQSERVHRELLPRLLKLALAAREAGISFNIDAEEAERLDLSLSLFEALARHPELADWGGLGFVLQAYQKRAPAVADWLIALARETGQRLLVRLVKGAYWDTEIKHAQELGLVDFPVYTRKANTDLSYLVCARTLLDASSREIYPQFATHNAHTLVSLADLAPPGRDYELQRLHGMGALLYDELAKHLGEDRPVRVYAPVGVHRDLLPYLVRRLLENGANSSFVNRFLDERTPVDELVRDVVAEVKAQPARRHPAIARPPELFRDADIPRQNAPGINLEDVYQSDRLLIRIVEFADRRYRAEPPVRERAAAEGGMQPVSSPADPALRLGVVRDGTTADVAEAFAAAARCQPGWDRSGGAARAAVLEAVAVAYERHAEELIALISREAGRTLDDAQAELREAIDFCRYYAALARRHFAAPASLAGPTGERNQLSLHGRGVFACISPWNFPLAIFTGQVVAALAAGNAVVAKPAEQTPLVAARAVQLMTEAGVPEAALHLLPGDGAAVGGAILREPQLAGVAFTGSTATARRIHRSLADRDGPIVPLIAETGGLNAMIADSTCLAEQLVDDVIVSAFKSAGQRCSALRVLFLQEDIADPVLKMLYGACDELRLGQPWELATDIGPVIDGAALEGLRRHMQWASASARVLYEYPRERLPDRGHFFGPAVIELERMAGLAGEVFGPILHVVRFRAGQLDSVVDEINACGYGLTLGLHSRIEGRAEQVFSRARVGNTYVNRNMVGAVVGVNPFGGQGLSGTGPKAGGPHYLFRFATEKTLTINVTANGGNVELLGLAADG